jgi:hypothetical protein
LIDKFDNENFLEVEGDRPDIEARNLKKVFDELLQAIDVSGQQFKCGTSALRKVISGVFEYFD